jgi:hypothetical protein
MVLDDPSLFLSVPQAEWICAKDRCFAIVARFPVSPGHVLVKAFLAGTPPALPPGCLVDVDLKAKDLLARLAPQTGSRVVEAYRDLRADLARRPTMTELFHRGYNPRTLPPELTCPP